MPLSKEEFWNVVTHGFGLLLVAGWFPVLLWEAWISDKAYALSGVIVFGLSMILLYAMSTLYHAQVDPAWKAFYRKMDHIAIFLLIAGTYTPFLLLFFEPPAQLVYLAIVWGLAIAGSIFKYFYTKQFNVLTTILYLAMGWMVVFMGKTIFEELSTYSLTWLIIGGLGYSIGTVFYLWEKLRFSHAIWHIFVLIGTVSHILAIWISLY